MGTRLGWIALGAALVLVLAGCNGGSTVDWDAVDHYYAAVQASSGAYPAEVVQCVDAAVKHRGSLPRGSFGSGNKKSDQYQEIHAQLREKGVDAALMRKMDLAVLAEREVVAALRLENITEEERRSKLSPAFTKSLRTHLGCPNYAKDGSHYFLVPFDATLDQWNEARRHDLPLRPRDGGAKIPGV